MTFLYGKYLPIVLVVIIVFILLSMRAGKKFDQALKTYWSLKPKLRYRLSHLLYLLFVSTLVIATLDLRGPEETIEGSVSDQKTLILIDSSSSMLAEDVRPNRFEKSIMLAKHFVRNAYGHQVGIVVFSDIQKMLIPFTDDIDLLDARLGGLVEQKELTGGSNIYQTIRESVRYFLENGATDPVGNILIFSDAEAHDKTFDMEIPDGVNVAVVGVGTAKGAPIPNRARDKSFNGYKKFNGEVVNSSLNEDLLKDLGTKIEHYKYWVVQAYSLPTEEILSFFNRSYLEKLSKSTQRVRPVLGHLLIIGAIILYALSVILSRGRTFSAISLFAFLIIGPNQELRAEGLEGKVKSGSATQIEKLLYAKGLMDAEAYHEASILYEETLGKTEDVPIEAALNSATSKMAAGNISRGLEEIADLKEPSLSKLTDKERSIARSNVLNAIKLAEEQKEQQKKEDEKKKQQGQKGNQQDQKQNQDSKKDKEKSDSEGNNDEKSEPKDEKGDDQKSNAEKLKERQDQQRKERSMKKVPALVKQVLEDDRKLQEEYLDTTTSKPEDISQPKDW